MTVSSLYGGLRPLLRGGSSCFGPSGRAKSVGHATENRNFTRGIVVDLSPNLIPGPGPPRRTPGSHGRLAGLAASSLDRAPSTTRNLAPTESGGSHDLPLPPDRENGRRSIHQETSTRPPKPGLCWRWIVAAPAVARHYKAKTASFTNTEPHQTWTGTGPSHPPCKKTPIVCIEMHVQPLRGWWRFFTGSDPEGPVLPSSTEAMHGAHYPLPTSNVTQIRGPTRVLGGSPTLCGDYLLTWEDIQSWVADFDSHCPPSRRKRASSGR